MRSRRMEDGDSDGDSSESVEESGIKSRRRLRACVGRALPCAPGSDWMRDDARGGEKRLRRLVWQSKEELGARSPMEICTRTEDACRQETRKSGRAPEGKQAGRSFSIQRSGQDVHGGAAAERLGQLDAPRDCSSPTAITALSSHLVSLSEPQ